MLLNQLAKLKSHRHHKRSHSGSPVVNDSDERHILKSMGLTTGQAMLIFAGLVGLASGLAASGFYWILRTFVRMFLVARPPSLSAWSILLIVISPALGGLLCGILLQYFAPDARGGVAEVIDAILHRNGFTRPRVGLFKALASSICIGTGGSAGREGPVVQIGASVGSTLAQIFRVVRKNAQVLVACGAASGIAAVFNAPIAGALFAAEIITGRFEMRELTLLFTASAMGTGIAQTLLHSRASFDIPSYEMVSIWELSFHVILGVACALVGHAFTRVLHESEGFFGKLKLSPVIKPALGGLAVGIIGLFVPQVFGTGGDLLEEIFRNPVGPGMLLLWMAAKLIATPLTLGSGGSGGDLMPALFLGGTLGGALGHWVHLALPSLTMPAGGYALVGATSLFAGLAHAPITGVILGFEMGHDYGVILPLMVSCSVSAMVSRRLRSNSLYTSKLYERGIDVELARLSHIDPLHQVRVEEVMDANPPTIAPETSIFELSRFFATAGKRSTLVMKDEKLLGIVTQSDFQKAMDESRNWGVVREIATLSLIVGFPDETLDLALAKLADRKIEQIPIVERGNPTRVIGMLCRSDILRGYRIGVSRACDPVLH